MTEHPEPCVEVGALREKVAALEVELESCRGRLEREKKLRLKTQASLAKLRREIEVHSKDSNDKKTSEKSTSTVEVQTENDGAWSHADYYYYSYYNSTELLPDSSKVPDQPNSDNDGSNSNCKEQLPSSDHSAVNGTRHNEHEMQDNVTCDVQESEDALLAEGTLAESLRAAAEAAVSQTGFTYDEGTGLYYDHSTGFYYNSETQLYYDPTTGIYYYCDVESGRYQFHSRVDLQSYGTSAAQQQTKDKKSKKKRRDAERPKDTDDQKSCSTLHCLFISNELSSSEEEEFPNVKKAKVDNSVRNSLASKERSTTNGTSLNLTKKVKHCTGLFMDDSKTESESEPEEGEITDSEQEDYISEDEVTSEETANSEETDSEDGDKIWPPCIRVIVIRSPVLQMGSLYIITAVKPATIGREKDMEHTLQIPEAGVSKFHAEVYFDHELQNYVLVDQGSQNGTVLNGNQILEPKAKSDPYVLEHGDEVKIGETVLSFHIHPGSETCDGCEPGQVRAHLRLDQKSESSIGPALTKEEKELNRRKVLKQIRVKYGLQNAEYENDNVVKNRKYKDRAGKRREMVGSEGTFHRDDAPASVHVEISDSNRGHKMLEKMGWKKGEGLGKSGSGMKDPITLQLHRKQAGLGASIPISAENVQMVNTKNKRNWEKARERFAENFQDPKPEKNVSKNLSWVRETAE
ncbi:angiogenic factor with G patch and FHA domains 1 isoform X2 [Sphaerodactylus townsendi]|uniref:angiogenic factor with G patch and FHA domains 1 isoform X2 n=1 Tax=Sphaerodactylus townsendi TaxID=933632 RepID=UPI0020267A2F|nr:angiogenic factor with G patch and FHA domains 1 isoform X2 [Sphaerodactylus townsendi]